LDRVVRTRTDIESVLGINALAVAPRIDKVDDARNGELHRKRRRSLTAWALAPVVYLGRMLKLGLGRSTRGTHANRLVGTADAMSTRGSLAIRDGVMRYVQDAPFSRYTEAM
jgi:hypothetical protein